MKLKQLLLVAVLLVALLAAWISAAAAASNKEAIAAQNNALNLANQYAEKELWVRAIPKYQEALTYQTGMENRRTIEALLLEAYLSYGSIDAYLELSQSRMDDGAAAEDEYIQMAEIYFASGDLANGITAAKNGIAVYSSEKCRELYEAYRYTYSLKGTRMQTILPSKSGSYMPAFTGLGWTFVDDRGRELFGETVFEEVTNFNDTGYAAVRHEGVYYVITSGGDRYSVDETGLEAVCALGSRIYGQKNGVWSFYNADFAATTEQVFEELTLADGGILAAKKDGKWGIIDESGAVRISFQFEDAAVNSWGSAFAGGSGAFQYDGKWYLVTTEGQKVFETAFAGMKAPECADGYIAVANEDGKWGFADRTGNLVIDYQYDDAKSFSDHLAAVKQGDEWVYISESGAVVIDNVFYDAQPFHNGIATVVTPDSCGILTLKLPNA